VISNLIKSQGDGINDFKRLPMIIPIKGEEEHMLFMTIVTYEPGVRDQVLKRLADEGPMPAGIKIVGEWSSATGGRVFRLAETDDVMALRKACYAWNDLLKIDIYPVVDLEEVKKMLQKK
jgi:hypothetical protein